MKVPTLFELGDESVLVELSHALANGCHSHTAGFAQLLQRERVGCGGESRENALIVGRRRHKWLDHVFQHLERELVVTLVESESKIVARRSRAMFDRQVEIIVTAAQIQVRVTPRMQFRGATQGLSLTRAGRTLTCVMDEEHSRAVFPFEQPEEGQERSHI